MCLRKKTVKVGGIAKGEVIGIAKGVEKEKVETVIRMYKKGKSIVDISDATDLSTQQIKEIIKEIQKNLKNE